MNSGEWFKGDPEDSPESKGSENLDYKIVTPDDFISGMPESMTTVDETVVDENSKTINVWKE